MTRQEKVFIKITIQIGYNINIWIYKLNTNIENNYLRSNSTFRLFQA